MDPTLQKRLELLAACDLHARDYAAARPRASNAEFFRAVAGVMWWVLALRRALGVILRAWRRIRPV